MVGRWFITWCLLLAVVGLGLAPGFAQDETPAEAPADGASETPAEPAENAPAEGDKTETPAPTAPSVKTEEQLPMLEEMKVPEAGELIGGSLRDWVVLQSGRVLVVESLAPRPGTIEKRIQAHDELKGKRAGLEGEELEKFEKELRDLNFLYVTVPGEKVSPEYRIPLKEIRQIIHHEDLMLRRMDMLAQAGNIDVALEFLNWMLENVPDWPGLMEKRGSLLLADARIRLEQGNQHLIQRNAGWFGGRSNLAGSVARLDRDAFGTIARLGGCCSLRWFDSRRGLFCFGWCRRFAHRGRYSGVQHSC